MTKNDELKNNIIFEKTMNANGARELPKTSTTTMTESQVDSIDMKNKLTQLVKAQFNKIPSEIDYRSWKDYCELFVSAVNGGFLDEKDKDTIIQQLFTTNVRVKTELEGLKCAVTQATLLTLKGQLKKGTEQLTELDNLNKIILDPNNIILDPNNPNLKHR